MGQASKTKIFRGKPNAAERRAMDALREEAAAGQRALMRQRAIEDKDAAFEFARQQQG